MTDLSPETVGKLTVMQPRSTDDEASALLDELSRLQSWCVMQIKYDRGAMAAADLVQRTRILIIERCKRPSALAAGDRS